MSKKIWSLVSMLTILTLLVAACTTPTVAPTQAPTEAAATAAPATEAPPVEAGAEIDCMGAAAGDTISMLYQWSGAEEERLNEILKPLVDACGIVIQPESTRDQALLDTKVQAGTPPDIAFWNVSQLVQYQSQLVPMD
ncbi:MAG: hypothetical protein JXB15_13665, partial [Anaerolineales bacterium]|nr:hypothetical protein [Anaerolineales bacterium]